MNRFILPSEFIPFHYIHFQFLFTKSGRILQSLFHQIKSRPSFIVFWVIVVWYWLICFWLISWKSLAAINKLKRQEKETKNESKYGWSNLLEWISSQKERPEWMLRQQLMNDNWHVWMTKRKRTNNLNLMSFFLRQFNPLIQLRYSLIIQAVLDYISWINFTAVNQFIHSMISVINIFCLQY